MVRHTIKRINTELKALVIECNRRSSKRQDKNSEDETLNDTMKGKPG